jgi:trk system potassium uptake protein TrkH
MKILPSQKELLMSTIKFKTKQNKLFDITPTRLIVLSFLLLILSGTAILMLPISSKGGDYTGFLDALFTATSASCVTGLVSLDTGTHWSIFGQIIILLLIQVGALGIVTLATSFSVILGRKVGLQGRRLALESTNYFSFEGVLNLARKTFIITLIAETLGAIILSFRFVPQFGSQGLYMAIFHSISAFCNAGFDIMGNYSSLTSFNDDFIVLITVSTLVIIGGLGFIVWDNLIDFIKTRTLHLHSKVVLSLSVVLIVLGTLLFLFFEYDNPDTLGAFSSSEKVVNSFFHSVASRTAGFNSFSIEKMNEISKMVTIFLMFVGAAPGSTGGGIKITTFAIIMIAIFSEIKGSQKTIIFNEKISNIIVFKALAIIGLSGLIISLFTALVLLVEKIYPFIDVLFEITSAFGTVGLSAIGSPVLSHFTKSLLILTMFIGRIGPLTFAISIALRNNKKPDKIYPEGKVMVG